MSSTGDGSVYVGRFAPSPTGDLHFGSLIAAVASFLQARSNRGRWLLRVEDIDPPREVEGSAARIMGDLQQLGMISDSAVLYQSTRLREYQESCRRLLDQGLAYRCSCSRKSLPIGGPYPGTCRQGHARGSTRLSAFVLRPAPMPPPSNRAAHRRVRHTSRLQG